MPTVRITVEGGDRWKAALRGKQTAIHRATRDATRRAVNHLDRAEKEALRRRSHKRGTPTPAPPGEPPAKVSGHLARSTRSRGPREIRRAVFLAEVGPTAVYSRIQELGGVTGRGHRTHLPPRPWVKPTTRAEMHRVHEIYRQAWEGAIRS